MLRGELVNWNDERGFGFIAGDDGQRYFVHISDIGRINTRPRQGDQVSFSPGFGRDGRPQAKRVSIAGANPRPTGDVHRRGTDQRRSRADWRWFVVLLLLGLLVATIMLQPSLWLLGPLYTGMGVVAFAAYRADKTYAELGHWRTSEAALLGLDLCFGILGGLIAQAAFRHKTRKPSYVASTVLLVGLHALWLGGLATGWIDVMDLLRLVGV